MRVFRPVYVHRCSISVSAGLGRYTFMQKKSSRDENFKLFKFISSTISTWVQHVLHGKSSSISKCTLKDLLHEGEPMKYGSMVYVYDWMMEEHQPNVIDYQPIRDNDYIEDSMTQHYMEFDEDFGANQDFGITLPSSRVC